MSTLLQADRVSVRFGGVQALTDVCLEAESGSAVGVIGPNGAGKTTLLDALSGTVPVSGGRVLLGGTDLQALKPQHRLALGMARTFQTLQLFDDLTVDENLQVAAEAGRRRSASDVRRRVDRAAEVAGVSEFRGTLPAHLRPAQRRLVALARALASEPRVLLLDEPGAGLDPEERAALARMLRQILDDGVAVVVVDHDVEMVLGVVDKVVVLDLGRVVADGPPQAVRTDPRVNAAYLGGGGTELTSGDRGTTRDPQMAPNEKTRIERIAIEAEHLTAGYGRVPVVRDLDLIVQEGEVVVLLGANGAGKTTTVRTLCGVQPPLHGVARVLGAPVAPRPHQMARRGLAFVPDDRALLSRLTVAESLRLATSDSGDGVLRHPPFSALEPLRHRKAGLLSGGEQQLLALARALVRRPRVLVVDELTLGLAPKTATQALDAVRRAADDDGVAVLLVEQQSERGLGVADRGYVLRQGRAVLKGSASELRSTPELLAEAYFGRPPGRPVAGENLPPS